MINIKHSILAAALLSFSSFPALSMLSSDEVDNCRKSPSSPHWKQDPKAIQTLFFDTEQEKGITAIAHWKTKGSKKITFQGDFPQEATIEGDAYQHVYYFNEDMRKKLLGKKVRFSLELDILRESRNGYEYRLGIWMGKMVEDAFDVNYSEPYFSVEKHKISLLQEIDKDRLDAFNIMLCSVGPKGASTDKQQAIIQIKNVEFIEER